MPRGLAPAGKGKEKDSRKTESGRMFPVFIVHWLRDCRQLTWPFILLIYSSVKAGDNNSTPGMLMGDYLVLVNVSH